ncbi:MAG: valine--tRNA ligase [Oscillospiraceae bacterium]|nr:valine--tRNA ligase [Oscillospiraceae bacterium]
MLNKNIDKVYNPKNFENKIYKKWIEDDLFSPNIGEGKETYTIVMPPPNITGQLHMGHALDNTLQDILIRFKRMKGFSTLWIPGTDHASIATEAKIVEDMKKDGITKDSIGREAFLERAWRWKEKFGNKIASQLKKLGASCDWTREKFTLDEGCNKAVNKVFIDLFNKGLIYRGEKIINWCTTCKTSISDAEVEHTENNGQFWHIKYIFSDNSGFLEVATTRPETLLGDTAIAVHPDDKRYSHLIGKTVLIPIINKQIPIIADTYVEMDFGTGCVKITPAHDINDFEVGLRHNLPIINIMNDDGSINENGSPYTGLDRYECRKELLKHLEEKNLILKTKDHKNNIGSCYRCNTIIEPKVSKQWFLKMESLAKPAIKAIENKDIKFVPERFSKTYLHWMENIRDWCISRQLWWGHRIPAYHCLDCKEISVSQNNPTVCESCKSTNIQQEKDTLDTWFSSGLWPFSTLGWPEISKDFKTFFPTNTLVTGYDIIFFWVARMIFLSIDQTETIPFNTVFIHGMVRDNQGRKMSKSLGNGIDPLDVIDGYGADALRFTLTNGTSSGNDMRFVEEKVKASRNFANKLWNATRFIIMNIDTIENKNDLSDDIPNFAPEDFWILSKYNTLVKQVTENLENFELGVASSNLYDFIWDIFCDWYIEISKSRIQSIDNPRSKKTAQNILVFLLSGILKLLHPFMPFITEEIWSSIFIDEKSIMIQNFPNTDNSLAFEKEEKDFEHIIDAIRGIRNIRGEMDIKNSKKTNLYISTIHQNIFKKSINLFKLLAGGELIEISERFNILDCVSVVTNSSIILIPIKQLVDKEKEKIRLEKELDICLKDIKFLSNKLENPTFVDKAPEKIVNLEKDKLEKSQKLLDNIKESLKKLETN